MSKYIDLETSIFKRLQIITAARTSNIAVIALSILALTCFAFSSHFGSANAHFFGETQEISNYQVVFAPYPGNPNAGDNSTRLNFSVLKDNSNLFGVYSAVVITEKSTNTIVQQYPYRVYELSDITIPHTFSQPGQYSITLMTRITDDVQFGNDPLTATFDLSVKEDANVVLSSLAYILPPIAAAAAGVIYYYKKKNRRQSNVSPAKGRQPKTYEKHRRKSRH